MKQAVDRPIRIGMHTYTLHFFGFGESWGFGKDYFFDQVMSLYELMDKCVEWELDGLQITKVDLLTTAQDDPFGTENLHKVAAYAKKCGLAVIQLNAGIGTVAGMSWTPSFEPFIILGYTLLTIVLATSGVHKLMGKLSNFNAACYFVILLFILLFGAAGGNRLLGTFFTSLGEFVRDYIPMISFADPIYQTGWQTNMTIYYYSWNIVPAFLSGLFYITLAYGRTLREFIVVNCIGPGVVTCLWYVVFGGSAMFSVVNGGDLYEQMQRFGDGIATFAFLESLPGGAILKWLFIILAILTFLTFSDSIAFSFPMLFMKELETDSSKTKVPKFMNVAVALFMGALTFVLLYIGGYDALNEMIVFLGFPLGIVMFLIVLSTVKMLTNREKYDVTYQEELAREKPEEKQPLRVIEQETEQIVAAE